MGNKLFCTECFNDKNFDKQEGIITHEVRGEQFQETVTKYICENCKEEIINDKDFDKSLLKSYNKYRKKHDLLLPRDIKNIRNKYDLSQRALSRLLGWGKVTIHRYENGSLQSTAHDQMLTFIKEPNNMLELLEKNKENIKNNLYNKIKNKTEKLMVKNSITDNIYVKKLQSIPKEYRGDNDFNIDKFCNIVLFFSQNINKLWKTKLLKLIFYSEFLNYKNNCTSIAGTPFVHWQHGPVPKHMFALLDILIEDYEVIELEEFIEFYEGDIINNKKQFNNSLFSNEEIKTLEYVLAHFKDSTASEIRNKTHTEKAYKKTNPNDLISYNYAYNINI